MNVNVLTGVSSDIFNTQNTAATQQSNSAESFDNILATAMNMVKETNNYQNNAEEEEKQWDFYNKWLSSSLAKKLVIVEIGEDFSNPNVIRWPFERIVMINQKAKMYRVHSTFYQIPKEIGDRACAFEMNGAQFIKELVKCC